MLSNIEAQWLGLIDYEKALFLQEELFHQISSVSAVNPGVVLGLEHPTVITLGRRGSVEADLNPSNSAPVVIVERGGQATLHSPGQLIIYPLLKLKALNLGAKAYVEFLLSVTAESLRSLGLNTSPCSGAGLMTNRGKIAFMGLRIRQGVSTHGISLNCSNELSLFSSIRPCGVQGMSLDSLALQGIAVEPQEVFKAWISVFRSRVKDLAADAELC